ncbi:MAG TPA: permease, partial [Ktedonobacterales bacterium]|nr:permease [Ktedonobacterales bacterium]
MLTTFVLTVGGYLRELAEIVVVGFVVAGVINAVVNKEAVARYLGGSPVVANLLGATIGIVTPLCCCSAIPTAMALYRAGSRRGPACAFLIATPWFNWYGLTALLLFLGPRATLAVAGSAILIAFIAGLLIDVLGARQVSPQALLQPATASAEGAEGAKAVAATAVLASPSCGCGDASCHVAAPDAPLRLFDFSDFGGKLRQGVTFALSMLRELGVWMVLGVLL